MLSRAPWALLLFAGCVSVTAAPGSGVSPPLNTCPSHPCTTYAQTPAPTCNGGVCLVGSLYSGLVLIVSLSQDSDYAPGQTIAIPYESLTPAPASDACASNGPPCVELPKYAFVQGAYIATQQNQSPPPTGVGWNLGNPEQQTALPVHVTYRPLWTTSSGPVDADSLGLPLDPVTALVVVETSPSSPPGPGPGPSIGFQASLHAGLYEATTQPDPPFDVAFPPDVKNVTLTEDMTLNDEDSLVLDGTTSLTGAPTTGNQFPSFSVSRLPDGLTGWQAYLRDVTTKRRLSSLATLGTRTNDCAATPCVVYLQTNHHPATGDALTGTELVIVPPSNLPLPTYVDGFTAGEFFYHQTYPTLPPAMTVNGKVFGVAQPDAGVEAGPVEAELYFEVTAQDTMEGIDAEDPKTGAVSLNTTNFEYSAETTAAIDETGAATYSITLSPGVYRVTVRPLDTGHEVTVVAPFTVDPTAGATSPDLVVDRMRQVQGSALVMDGRFMAGATVDALPTACVSGSAPSCMPREGLATTAADGTFTLDLDPGGYTLRVEPQSGTVFPWVTQALLVGPTDVAVPPIYVPAPVNAGTRLFDPFGNAVVGAVIRVYQLPTTGGPTPTSTSAVEVGRAFTDPTGTYDLYLAPSSP
jgi:hypothetical protein